MIRHLLYLVFGLSVITAYTAAARTGYMFASSKPTVSMPVGTLGRGVPRSNPSFWSTGYLGGK